jgi:hypothetical protein
MSGRSLDIEVPRHCHLDPVSPPPLALSLEMLVLLETTPGSIVVASGVGYAALHAGTSPSSHTLC